MQILFGLGGICSCMYTGSADCYLLFLLV